MRHDPFFAAEDQAFTDMGFFQMAGRLKNSSPVTRSWPDRDRLREKQASKHEESNMENAWPEGP